MYGVQVSDVKFHFDGEVVKDSDTPQSLDMEDENMVDVKVSTPTYTQHYTSQWEHFNVGIVSFCFVSSIPSCLLVLCVDRQSSVFARGGGGGQRRGCCTCAGKALDSPPDAPQRNPRMEVESAFG